MFPRVGNDKLAVTELDTQEEMADENAIYCGYGSENTKTERKEDEKEQPVTPHISVYVC